MIFDWTRYWLPAGIEPLLSTDGYFHEPYYDLSGGPIKLFNKEALTLDELEDRSCLVLLGEAGAGKTTELNRAIERALARGEEPLVVRMGSLGGPQGLYRRVIDHERVRAWKAGRESLTLFLDAFDEGLLQVENAVAILREEFLEEIPAIPSERSELARNLKLRITCRAGDWPASLSSALRGLWGDDRVATYQLAPLRQIDVELAATKRGIDPPTFMEALRTVDAGPWAAVPLSLKGLLDAFVEDGSLPHSKVKLYERAALRLCHEHNKGRQEASRTRVDPGQRMVVAARIAALQRFGRRTAINLEQDSSIGMRSVDEPLALELEGTEILGREIDEQKNSFQIGWDVLDDAVRHSALFVASAPDRYRWSHEAYADFLAAWYLRHRKLDARQAISLTCHPDDGRVVPQFRAAAAWLAAMDCEIGKVLIEKDPLVVLSGDPQALSEDLRFRAVDALLEQYEVGELHDFRDRLRSYRRLWHQNLAIQIRGWIVDSMRGEEARLVAVAIAAQNDIAGLVPSLVTLALDAEEPLALRQRIVYALTRMASSEQLTRLRPLALSRDASDPDGHLLLAARRALWPRALSFQDLLASLDIDPMDEALPGYWAPLLEAREFDHPELTDEQLESSMKWLVDGGVSSHPSLAISVVETLLRRNEINSERASRLAGVLLDLATRDRNDRIDSSARERVRKATEEITIGKQVLQGALAHQMAELDDAQRRWALHFLEHELRLYGPHDVPWMVEEASRAGPGPLRDFYLERISQYVLRYELTPNQLTRAYDALRKPRHKDPALAAIADEAFNAWVLDSEQAREAKAEWWRFRHKKPADDPLSPPISERVDEALRTLRDGDASGWTELCYTLTLRPESSHQRDHGDWLHDVTDLSGWKSLDDRRRDEIVEAGLLYLRSYAVGEEDWLVWAGGEKVTMRVLDAMKAFFLLYRFRNDLLDDLPNAIWTAWAPVFFLHPCGGDVTENEVYVDLLRQAFRSDAVLARRTLERALSLPIRNIDALLRAIEEIGDPEADAVLLAAAERGDLNAYSAIHAMEQLLRGGVNGAFEAVTRSMAAATQVGEQARWALRLFVADPERAWAVWGQRFESDEPFARAVLEATADEYRGLGVVANGPASFLLALARRLYYLYPPALDPPIPKGVYSPTTPHRIRDLRGAFERVLASQGTPEALEALSTLNEEQPERDVGYYITEARERFRQQSAEPTSPAHLLRLVADRHARLVRSPQELFSVVAETLEGFESWLRAGEAPRVFDLWNVVPASDALRISAGISFSVEDCEMAVALRSLRKKANESSYHFPKDENQLSDLALRFLRDMLVREGIVVAREVEVKKGHSTDLYVALTVRGAEDAPFELARVVIEVKTSWHDHVYSAMERQLVNGYLDGASRSHGIYLVGWYDSERWYEAPPEWSYSKRERTRRGGIQSLRRKLRDQARVLTTEAVQIKTLVVDCSLPATRAST